MPPVIGTTPFIPKLIGIPRPSKQGEARLPIGPDTVQQLTDAGHTVLFQEYAGEEVGWSNEDFEAAGATKVDRLKQLYRQSQIIVKVKEPQKEEIPLLRRGQVIFSYLHPAGNWQLCDALLEAGIVGIAFETIEGQADGRKIFPLLDPMSRIAGSLSIVQGARFLTQNQGGPGVLLQAIGDRPGGNVAIFGCGIAGHTAAEAALGLGAQVTVCDLQVRSFEKLSSLDTHRLASLETVKLFGNADDNDEITRIVKQADLVVMSAMVAGGRAPLILTYAHISQMKPGSVIVDISVDQGGNTEVTQDYGPTSHRDPIRRILKKDSQRYVQLYAVPNMPADAAYDASRMLEPLVGPRLLTLANRGYEKAIKMPEFAGGLNVDRGVIKHPGLLASYEKHSKYSSPSDDS